MTYKSAAGFPVIRDWYGLARETSNNLGNVKGINQVLIILSICLSVKFDHTVRGFAKKVLNNC